MQVALEGCDRSKPRSCCRRRTPLPHRCAALICTGTYARSAQLAANCRVHKLQTCDGAESSTFFVPEGRAYRVVGLATIAFTEEAQDVDEGNPPVPDSSVYLGNMSVDKDFRRCRPASCCCHVCDLWGAG